MSFWISGHKRSGRRPLFVIAAHPTLLLAVLSIVVILLLPWIQWLRGWFPP